MRYHAHYHTSGQGHLYQQRYKSFPIQDDDHFFVVCRYVERNALPGRLREACRRLALGFALAMAAETQAGPANAFSVAACPASRLGGPSQPASVGERAGGGPAMRPSVVGR